MIGIGADGEGDAIGLSRRDLDHARTGGGDLDRNFGEALGAVPFEPAREAVAIDGAAAQIRLQGGEIALELGDPCRRSSDALHRGIAAPDSQDGTPVALDLQRQGGRRGHRRIARDRIGDAGAEMDRRGSRGGEHELPPHLRAEILAVGKENAREAHTLGEACDLGGATRIRGEDDTDLHATLLLTCPRPFALAGRTAPAAGARDSTQARARTPWPRTSISSFAAARWSTAPARRARRGDVGIRGGRIAALGDGARRRAPHARRRRLRRRARLRRHPHPLRRAGLLGPHAHDLAVARRDLGGDGQLRLRHRADPPGASRPRSCARSRTSRACRSTRSRPASAPTGRSRPSRSTSTPSSGAAPRSTSARSSATRRCAST